MRAIEKHCKGAVEYIGIASDEMQRLRKERKGNKRFPLAEWGMKESDCLALCYERGFDWNENGVKLYSILKRVSCWCCGNKNLTELRNYLKYLPRYWDGLKELQSKTDRTFKNRMSIFELEEKFSK